MKGSEAGGKLRIFGISN